MTILGIAVLAAGVGAVAAAASVQLANTTVSGDSTTRHLLSFDNIYSLCGVDLVGGDIWQARHPGPDALVGECGPERRRRVVCSPEPSRDVVHGAQLPANIDMPGNDIDNRPGKVATDCIKICATSTFCFAYTWTNYQGGTCWLKIKASPYVYSPGSTARFSGRVTNPDTCLA